jgi:hypothetical protein
MKFDGEVRWKVYYFCSMFIVNPNLSQYQHLDMDQKHSEGSSTLDVLDCMRIEMINSDWEEFYILDL